MNPRASLTDFRVCPSAPVLDFDAATHPFRLTKGGPVTGVNQDAGVPSNLAQLQNDPSGEAGAVDT